MSASLSLCIYIHIIVFVVCVVSIYHCESSDNEEPETFGAGKCPDFQMFGFGFPSEKQILCYYISCHCSRKLLSSSALQKLCVNWHLIWFQLMYIFILYWIHIKREMLFRFVDEN